MKQLLRKPFLLSLLLSLPLWIVFNNYIVALCTALLIAFLLSMIDSLIVLQRQQQHTDSTNCDTSVKSSQTDKE